MSESKILVYTDGACSGNPGPGGWAAIVVTPDGSVRELGGGEAATTNNRMEMRAAIEALESVAARKETIELFTDSTYVIHGVTEWVHGWKRRGWVTAAKAPVLNRDLWEKLDALNKSRVIEWRYVKGHAGHAGNERCDEIAVAFSLGERVDLYQGPLAKYAHAVLDTPALSEARRAESNGPPVSARVKSEKSSKAKSPGGEAARPSGPSVYLSLVGGKLERHSTWDACNRRVKGVPNARYRKASSPSEEAEILRAWGFQGD